MGLVPTLHRSNPEKGSSFSTYAYHWVMGEIRLEVRREGTFDRPLWIVRLQDDVLRTTDRFAQNKCG